MRSAAVVLIAAACAGCPGPKHPVPVVGAVTLEIGRDGGSLRGVAGDETHVFAAITSGDRTAIEARRGAALVWQAALVGGAGPLARSGALLAVTLGGTGTVADLPMRGSPGAVVVALDAAAGTPRWRLAIDASEWCVITSIAPTPDGFVIGGSFSGTLRAASSVVSSAGKIDGFVARVSATGAVAWLIRVGGANADAVQGVAAAGDRIAITGTFAPGAELQGEPLQSTDDKSPAVDVFVAELDAKGMRKWVVVFGGKLDDSVAGVAIDGKGRIAVAATVRDKLKLDTADVSTQGAADGLLAMFGRDGAAIGTTVLGGFELDGLRAIAAVGNRVVVGGFYRGTISVGRESLKSSGGDDAYFATFDGTTVTAVRPIKGSGREEITAIAPVPGGFVAGVAHTAGAMIDGQALASPRDPASGAGLIVRPVR